MKKLYLMAAALCLLLCQSPQVQAEILTYEGVGEYYMEEENISLSEAKDKAKLMAEVAVVEQCLEDLVLEDLPQDLVGLPEGKTYGS
jgi:hypothetical protein